MQLPDYPDEAALNAVEKELASFPPLVFAGEARQLRKALGEVAAGRAFMLQGGDCAETFAEHGADPIRDFFRVFLQMAVVLTFAASRPVVKVGRIAGQFAKPRSADMEKRDGLELPSYRGDIINDIAFTADARRPIRTACARPTGSRRPRSICSGRSRKAATRTWSACTSGRWASCRQPAGARYEELADHISETLNFMRACGITSDNSERLRPRTSTRATRRCCCLRGSLRPRRFHERQPLRHFGPFPLDRRPHAAAGPCACRVHAGLKNPIGLKCGPSLDPEEAVRLIDVLNPSNEPGRLTLIVRYGAEKIDKYLPQLIRAVNREGKSVVWSCDPMHGNTITEGSYKTRPFNDIMREVGSFFGICQAEGAYPGGIHIEMTGKNVTECTGGAQSISATDLSNRYHTYCDPRLNADQALEMAFLVAERLRRDRAQAAPEAALEF